MNDKLLNDENINLTFEDEKELNAEELLTNSNTDFNFNLQESIGFERTINRATKPKNLTKKQKKIRSKIAKQSRRKNRH